MTDWVIVRAERSWLKRVAAEIGGWVPVETRVTKPAKKHTPVISQIPIFPSWVFLPYDQGDDLELLRTVSGVRGLVRYGKRVMMLTDDDIQALKDIETRLAKDPRTLEDAPVSDAVHRVGDQVHINGLLGGTSGRVLEVRGNSQYVVLIGKNLKVEVEGCLLSAYPV